MQVRAGVVRRPAVLDPPILTVFMASRILYSSSENSNEDRRMRLTRLTLKNWRNFKKADFKIQDRMLIIGSNASGKSNLLDALLFLKQIASPGGGFQKAVESRGGMSRVRCLAARSFNHGWVTMAIEIGDDKCSSRWSYDLTFTAERRGLHRPIVKSEIVRKNGEVLLERPTEEDDKDPEQMTQTDLEQVKANKEFRNIVEFLKSIRYLHLVPHIIRDPERSGDRNDDPYGADFLLRIAKTPQKTRNRHLKKINEALKAAVPQLDRLELKRDKMGSWHLEARYQHWRPQGALQNERDFSDGTLRLIGLLWSLIEEGRVGGPVLLEEPELTLHSSVVCQIPAILSRVRANGGPQVVVTTHSNEILHDQGLGKDEVVVLIPGADGTETQEAAGIPDIQDLLDSGLSMAEILLPKTQPEMVHELPQRITQ